MAPAPRSLSSGSHDLHLPHFKWDILANRLRELAFLNRGVSIRFRDLEHEQERDESFLFNGGIVEYISI